jgi:plasmid stabilization system protein ParE
MEQHRAVLETDLPEIYAAIAGDNPVAAERVLDAVEDTLAQISAQPDCGIQYRSRNPTMKNARMLPVSGFHSISRLLQTKIRFNPSAVHRSRRSAFAAIVCEGATGSLKTS